MFKIFVCYSFVGLFNVYKCWPENCTVCMLGDSGSPGTHFTGGCELSDGCWEPNLDLSIRPAGAFNP